MFGRWSANFGCQLVLFVIYADADDFFGNVDFLNYALSIFVRFDDPRDCSQQITGRQPFLVVFVTLASEEEKASFIFDVSLEAFPSPSQNVAIASTVEIARNPSPIVDRFNDCVDHVGIVAYIHVPNYVRLVG